MRLGLVFERKADFPWFAESPDDVESELLSVFEEDELLSGLRDAGYDVVEIGDVARLSARPSYWRNRCDLVLNRSVGYRGLERKLLAGGVLEAAKIPYIGSTPYVSMLARHKFHTKLILDAADIKTPPSAFVTNETSIGLEALRYPAIVKPVAESSSIGIDSLSIVTRPSEALARARMIIERYHQPALVETFVRGFEIEVPILVDPTPRALGAIAIARSGKPIGGDDFLTSDMVYDDQYGFAPCPSSIDSARIIDTALRAGKALGIRDYGRVDLRVDDAGTPWVIEISTTPHLQSHSSFFFAAKSSGQRYHELLRTIVNTARLRLGI